MVNFVILADLDENQRKGKKRNKYLNLARELLKKTMGHEGDGDTNYCWSEYEPRPSKQQHY